jgi:hypothetical protein
MALNIGLVWYAVIALANLVVEEKTPLFISLFVVWWMIIVAALII